MTIGPRVLVVGTSGSGKSRVAVRLARALGGPHIELDELKHGPGWSERSVEGLRERTSAAIADREVWVADQLRRRTRPAVAPGHHARLAGLLP